MKRMSCVVVAMLILAGCSNKPVKDATIEDRGVPAAAKEAKGNAAASAGTAPATASSSAVAETPASAAAADGKATPDAAAATTQKPDAKVATHALVGPAVEVKPLDGSAQPGGATGGGLLGAGKPAPLSLKDPNGPLARRIIQFDYDSAEIREEYRSLLEAHATYLKQTAAAKAILQGHADERGSREYNLALGQRRAESVYKAMQLLGIGDTQLEAVSLGEEKPIAEGQDEAAWQQNRRTEILYHGE